MQHRGEIIKEAIYKSGVPITALAKRLGKSRRWMYLMFENSNVSLDIVLQIGKFIHYDFGKAIKGLTTSENIANEPFVVYGKEVADVEYWKNKYLKLLEEYNDLLKNGKS